MIMVIGPTKKKAEAKAEQRRSREQHDQRALSGSEHGSPTQPADEQPDAGPAGPAGPADRRGHRRRRVIGR